MKLKKSFFTVGTFLIFCYVFGCHPSKSQNIALGKEYVFSEAPNYNLTKGGDDSDLTDGLKKSGFGFWQDKSTVGWRNKNKVVVNLDLGEEFSIDGFLVNTARNSEAEVEYPLNCFVFTSIDNKEFLYHGDLMLSRDNTSGKYKVQSFELRTKKTVGRYVKLIFYSKSKFLFMDEVEVFGTQVTGKGSTNRNSLQYVERSQLEKFMQTEQNRSAEIRSKYFEILEMQSFVSEYDNSMIDEDLSRISIDKLSKVHKEFLKAKNLKLSETLPQNVIFTPIDNIEALKHFKLTSSISKQQVYGEESVSSVSNKYFFSLVNNGKKTQVVKFDFLNGAQYDLYEIVTVSSLKSGSVRDALKPVGTGSFRLDVGDNKFFAVFPSSRNNLKGRMQVMADNKVLGTLPLEGDGVSTTSIRNRLNVNVWAYLDKPLLKDHKRFVVDDLEKANVNTIVVHSDFIDRFESQEFTRLKEYLKNFKNLNEKKVLLFYNLEKNAASKFGGAQFLDKKWKENFVRWYTLMQENLEGIGVNIEEIYFYPFDEIKVNEVSNFIQLNKWAKKTIPNFKTFLTIIDEETYEAGNYADIVQLSLYKIKTAKKIKNNNLWIYDVLDNSRDRDPYQDYRLMSWKAYYYDIKGVGFWNYCNLPSKQDADYKKVINGNSDYSVLYLGDKEVLTSIRWKFFQVGINDYYLLKTYETKLGGSTVKKMVKEVIDNASNSNIADEVLKKLKKL